MGMTRRDVIKISVLSGAAVGLPVSHALGDSVSGNRIAESRLPEALHQHVSPEAYR